MPRYMEYGKFASEQANFSCRRIEGRSIIIDTEAGYPSNLDSGQVTTFTLDYDSSSRQKELVRADLATVRSLIGHAPVILAADLCLTSQLNAERTGTLHAWRVLNPPTMSQVSYRDRATGVRWTNDGYSPLPGADVGASPFWTGAFVWSGVYATQADNFIDITDELERVLLRGINLDVMVSCAYNPSGQVTFRECGTEISPPYVRMWYLFGIEFFNAQSDGSIDLASMVDNTDETSVYYLGAIDRGVVGTASKGWLRNLSNRTLKLVEILDDHPEWTDPVAASTNTGTGALDHVTVADAAVSQKYTVRFSSPTEFEIKAEAYRDNTTGLHTSYDGDDDWEGTTAGDWTAPSGGLTIPAAAWETGMLAADEFVVYVRGNSTESDWPADSNDQIEITYDDDGDAPVVADYRPIAGRRNRLTAAVTIDATTKQFPVRADQAALWVAGTRAFVSDGVDLHDGDVSDSGESEIGTDVFTGSGLDDLTLSGEFHGNEWWDLRIEIDSEGTPDTFKWSKNGGSDWEDTGIEITGSAQHLEDNVYVTFAATTGHTSADRWDASVQPWYVELENLDDDSTVYAVNSRIGTGLPFLAVEPAIYGQTTADAGASESLPNRIYLEGPNGENPTTLGLVTGQTFFLSDLYQDDVAEYGVVQTVGSTYIDAVSFLDEDYSEGALITVVGTGERAFHMRPTATSTTDYGLKEARINARV